MKRPNVWLLFVGTSVLALSVSAENWPQFRGPNHNYLPAEPGLPQSWSADENIRWTAEVPGEGWASPIVWGDKVFIVTAIQEVEGKDTAPPPQYRSERIGADSVYRWEVHCLDRTTGKELWKRVALRGNPRVRTHPSNTYASETPVTDGERVYVYFGMMGLFCYDFDGNLVWTKDLGGYTMDGDWGTGSSPILYGGNLYVQIDNEEDSFLVVLDPGTGDERWRIPRDARSSWSTPMIWRNKVRTELVMLDRFARSYDPDTGALLWSLDMKGGRASASPTGDAETLYFGNEARRDGGGRLFAVRAGASGDVTPSAGRSTSDWVLWSRPQGGPQFASPLLYEGYLYILERERGRISCYDAATGEAAYFLERLPGARSFWASPWGYDGKVFCPDDRGTTHVLRAGPELEILATNTIDDTFWSSPAFSGGTMILRGVDKVYGIQE